MRFVKPLDEALIRDISQSHSRIVTLEDNAIQGGAGSAVSEFLNAENIQIPIINLGIPDSYIEHATREEQLEEIQLTGEGIIQRIRQVESGKLGRAISSVSVAQ
jgi:1-deoxy-D-xylulose-5-phosphate synthase